MADENETYADRIGQEEYMRLVKNFFAHDYQDRGAKKWQGYFLSDHTAALKREAAEMAIVYPPLPKQSSTVVRQLLGEALATGKTVSLQLNELDPEGHMYPPTEGKLQTRTDHDEVMINGQFIAISAIRHVDVIAFPVQ